MKKIKTVIIDDERSGRQELRLALQRYSDFELIGEAENAGDGKLLIETAAPDLIFLDIKMPEKSGFDLLESLDNVPFVIFITAFDQYAVQAFEVSALDYLLKPVRDERFAKAIEKVRRRLGTENSADRKIFIKDGERCHLVRLDEIYRIESLENYTRLYFQGKKVLQRRSLRQWEKILDETVFFRVNRNEIINIRHIAEINQTAGGRLRLRLKTGELLEVSNRQTARFKGINRV